MKHTVYSPTAAGTYNQCPASRLHKKFEQYQKRRKDFGLYLTDASSLLDRLYLNDASLRSLRLNASLAMAVPSAINARRVDTAVEEAKTLQDALSWLAEEDSALVAAAIRTAKEAQEKAQEKEKEAHSNHTAAAELPFPLPTVLHPLQLKPFTSYTGGVAFRLQSAAEEEERQRQQREAEEQAIACGGGPGGSGAGGMSAEMKDERVPLPPLPALPPPSPLVVSEALLFHEHLRALEIEPEVMRVFGSKDPSSSSIPMSPVAGWETNVGESSAASPSIRETVAAAAENTTTPHEDTKDTRDPSSSAPEIPTHCMDPPKKSSSDRERMERNSHRLFHWSRLMQSLCHLPLRSLILADLHLTPTELEHTLCLVGHLTGVDEGWNCGQGVAAPLNDTHRKEGTMNAASENENREDPASQVDGEERTCSAPREEAPLADRPPAGVEVKSTASDSLPSVHHRDTMSTPPFHEVRTGDESSFTTGAWGKEGAENKWGEMEKKQVDFSPAVWTEMVTSLAGNARKGTLEFLDLRHTTIPPYLAGKLGRLLFHPNSSLVRVELEGCCIGDQGAEALFSFFPFFAHHVQFTSSNFSAGRGEDGGITFLASPSYQLRVLGLQWNQLTSKTERFVLSTLPPLPGEAYGEAVRHLRDKEGDETLYGSLQNMDGYLSEGNNSVGEMDRGKNVFTPVVSSATSLEFPSSPSVSLSESAIVSRECSEAIEHQTAKKDTFRDHEIAALFEKSLFLYLDGNYLSSEGCGLYKRYWKVFQASKKVHSPHDDAEGSVEEAGGDVSHAAERTQRNGWRQRARHTVVPPLPPVRLAAMTEDALAVTREAERKRLGRWRGSDDGGIPPLPSLLRCMLCGLEEQLRHDTAPQEVAIRKKVWRRERRAARTAATVVPVEHTEGEGEASGENRVVHAESGPRMVEDKEKDCAGVPPTSGAQVPSSPFSFMDPLYCLRVAAKMVEYPSLGGSPYALESLAPIKDVNS